MNTRYSLIGAGAVVAASSFALMALLKNAQVDLNLTDKELRWEDSDIT